MIAQALSQEDINSINNDTVWYRTDSGSDCSGSDIPSSVNLSTDIIAAINKLKPAYVQASQATGVPWQVLAAIHYRENSNSPNGDLQAGNPIGGPYSQASTSYAKYGYPKSIEESAEFAAKELIGKASAGIVKKPVNVPNPDSEGLKDALFGYNGRADAYAQQAADLGFNPNTQPYEGSPYVMNQFDAKHMNMKIIGSDFGGISATDTRPGAYTIYSRLGGVSGDCSGVASASKIVQVAASQVGTSENPPGTDCGGTSQPDGHTVASYTDGHCEQWCADFVSWVYNKAGSPLTGGSSGGWRIAGAFTIRDWLKANGVYIERGTSGASPQPGDIIVFAGAGGHGHIGIVENFDGRIHTIEGNAGESVTRRDYGLTDNYVYGWGRMKQ